MRWAAAIGALAAMASAGCGGIKAPDLFIVERSGPVPGARLTLLVNEEGGLRCNGGPELKLSESQLVQARALQEELRDPASEHVSLPARAGSVFGYHLRDENGSVSFADNSTGQPKVFRNLALFVLQVAQQNCKQRTGETFNPADKNLGRAEKPALFGWGRLGPHREWSSGFTTQARA